MISGVNNQSFRLPTKSDSFVPGEVLVRLKGDVRIADTFADQYNAEVKYEFELPQNGVRDPGDLLQLQLPEGLTTEQAVAKMKSDPRVLYVEPNYIYHLSDDEGTQPPTNPTPPAPQPPVPQPPAPQPPTQFIPNDLVEGLWGLHNTGQNGGTANADINAPEAWTITTGRNDGPLIALIDTGIDYNHPDLKENVWTNPGEIEGDGIDNDNNGVIDDVHGYNANADNGNPMDGHSHGSHCAGTIGAVGNNGIGVVGINHHARIMAVKIFDDSGSTNSAAITRGILYAGKMNARITSNSWGGGAASDAIKEAFATTPALHIMASGNNGTNNDTSPHYPSNYDLPNKISVAASDRTDRKAKFSNYGVSSVDIAAPGKDILSTVPGGGYGTKSGTSMATPHVTGVAALVATMYPEASNDELKARIFGGSDKLSNWEGIVAHGRLNAQGALTFQPPAPPPPPPPPPPPTEPTEPGTP